MSCCHVYSEPATVFSFDQFDPFQSIHLINLNRNQNSFHVNPVSRVFSEYNCDSVILFDSNYLPFHLKKILLLEKKQRNLICFKSINFNFITALHFHHFFLFLLKPTAINTIFQT